MNSLPLDVYTEISKSLSNKDIGRLQQTSKSLRIPFRKEQEKRYLEGIEELKRRNLYGKIVKEHASKVGWPAINQLDYKIGWLVRKRIAEKYYLLPFVEMIRQYLFRGILLDNETLGLSKKDFKALSDHLRRVIVFPNTRDSLDYQRSYAWDELLSLPSYSISDELKEVLVKLRSHHKETNDLYVTLMLKAILTPKDVQDWLAHPSNH